MTFTLNILMILLIILCIILISIILLQNPKGGLSENLGINSQTFGIENSNQFIEKSTWIIVIIITCIIIITNIINSDSTTNLDNNIISKQK